MHEDSVSPKLKEIIEEACAYLNCARSTLFRLEAQGLLVPKRFGRKVLYDRDALDTYIKNGGAA